MSHHPTSPKPALMPRRLGLLLTFTLAAAAFVAVAAQPAAAGSYEVTTTCAGWEAAGASGGIAVYATPYMGCAILTARNVRGNFSSPRGAAGSWSFVAPPGASIRDVSVWGQASANSGWQAAVFFDGGAYSGHSVINCPGGAGCPGAARTFNNVFGNAGGAAALRAWVRCVTASCPNGDPHALMEIWDARIAIEDNTAPAVNAGSDLASGGWQGGTRQLVIDANDNVGIQETRSLIDGVPAAAHRRACNYGQKVPCPNGADTLSVPLAAVAEGKHTLTVQAVDTAGNLAGQDRALLVDTAAPVAPVSATVDGGVGWRSQNAWKITWANPPQRFAPIAGARYSLCPAEADSSDKQIAAKASKRCVTGQRSKANLTEIADLKLPDAGAWTLKFWLADGAGNHNPDSAVKLTGLGYDPTPPTVAGFRAQDPNDPARVTVQAGEDASGLAGGAIELRRRGAEAWRPLPTEVNGSAITALVDDETLRKGRYELRATVTNQAGLQQGTDRRTDGTAAALKLPIRMASRLRAGRLAGKICRGRGAKRRCRQKLRRKVPVELGRRITLRGRLVVAGKPVKRQPLEVWQRVSLPGAGWERVGAVRTNARGRVRYKTAEGPARALRFRYPGTSQIRGDNATVRLRVQAATSIRSNRRHAINGEPVTFNGKLKGAWRPPGGVLVELQVHSRGRWRTFAQPRADATTGEWSYEHTFDTVTGGARFAFRARIRRQAGLPLATGHSRTVKVSVHGL